MESKSLIRVTILLSAACTFLVTAGLHSGAIPGYRNLVTMARSLKTESGPAVSENIASLADGLSDEELSRLADEMVRRMAPQQLLDTARALTADAQDRASGRLGVYIADLGANRLEYAPLKELAIEQFMSGTFVERDFQKVAVYLADPLISSRDSGRFLLALYLSDEHNAGLDIEAARTIMVELAARKYKPAVAWLKQHRLPD